MVYFDICNGLQNKYLYLYVHLKIMTKDNIERYFNTDSFAREPAQSYLGRVKDRLLQIYSNVKMYLSPSYAAADTLCFTGR